MIAWLLAGIFTGTTATAALAVWRRLRFMPWKNEIAAMSGEVHTLPVRDLVEHELNDECVCGPTGEAVPRDDGSTGWHYVHHSLDGREQWENED